mmetsp:Transcript_31237/g.68600  ORF Transcript_31237/g.68600 Transcript_31237/m.68600 type:complete len:110 (+) Transcript_31237:1100-1429(+)
MPLLLGEEYYHTLVHCRYVVISDVTKHAVRLDLSSPEYYLLGSHTHGMRGILPLCLALFVVDPGSGYQWTNEFGVPCDINWLCAEPTPSDDGYVAYRAALQTLETERSR